MTVLRYISVDWSKAASASRFLCSKVPASTIVFVAVPTRVQRAVSGVMDNWSNWLEASPTQASPSAAIPPIALFRRARLDRLSAPPL